MAQTLSDVIIEIADKLKDNIISTESKQRIHLNNCIAELHVIDDISKKCIYNAEAISVLNEAQNDLLNSLIFSCQGFYRNAYICLRSSLELTLSFIFYYDHNFDYILWKSDLLDMTWTRLTDIDKGVFNKYFYQLIFKRSVNLDSIINNIKEIYHQCSQSVHGKYDYMQTTISPCIKYDDLSICNFLDLFDKTIEIIKVVLYLRFKEIIEKNLDYDDVKALDVIIKRLEV